MDATNMAGLSRIAMTLGEPAAPVAIPSMGRVPRHCSVVLLGDWLEPIEVVRSAIAGLVERQVSGHVLQILDPAEVELPYTGRVRFRGVGEGAPSTLIGRTEVVRGAYAGRLAEHQASLAAICHGAGLTFSVHRTDHAAVGALLNLYSVLGARTMAG
jgi:uncharacterized protein (DUF58 family)